MKVSITVDEWWPVYEIDDSAPTKYKTYEIDDELYERAERVFAEFNEVQNLICELKEKANNAGDDE